MRYCSKCGAQLEDNAILCPGCGADVDVNKQVKQSKRGMAIAGFCCSFFIPVLGFIFGGIGLDQAKRNPKPTGKAFSIWAIVISAIVLALKIIF